MKALLLLFIVLLFGCESAPQSPASGRSTGDDSMSNSIPEEIVGTWVGAILIQGQELDIVVRFDPEAEPKAQIDIPPQNAFDLPLSNTSFDLPAVYFELAAAPGTAVFDGRFERADEGQPLIEGSFTQGAAEGRFTLRPEPEQGAPDTGADAESGEADLVGGAEELSIDVGPGSLYGTLQIPALGNPGQKPPVLLFVAGSGATDRRGNTIGQSGGSDALLQLANSLVGRGYATLRYDKRGVGESVWTGLREEDLTLDTYIEDMLAWAARLRDDERLGPVVYLGHSEGGLISMEAARREAPEALVLLAAAGRPLDELVLAQLSGQPEQILDEARRIFSELRAGNTVEDVPANLAPLFRESVQPFLRSALAYEPTEIIAELDVPTLVVGGGRDIQVPPEDARRLADAADSAQLRVIEDMNHVLKEVGESRAENIRAYQDPNLPLAPELPEAISDFLSES